MMHSNWKGDRGSGIVESQEAKWNGRGRPCELTPREAIRDPVRRKLTYEDYLLFPEDGNRHEILDGEHFVTAAPNLLHQSIVVELTSWIAPFVRRHRLGRLYVAPADVLLGEHDVVQPDLLFVSQARARILPTPTP